MIRPNYIKLIIQGWINVILDIVSDLKYKKYFDHRYNICKICEKNKSGICSVCKCVLKAKTKSENSACPMGKWDTIEKTISADK